MKNKFTYFLMSGLFALGSPFALHAQTDVTDDYLKNPSFESNFTDWSNEGMKTQSNTSFSKKDGTLYVEKWVSQGSKVGDACVSQVLTSLKNGVYELKVAAQNIQQNNSTSQSGAFIFADDVQEPVGTMGDYSLTFTVIEGQATVGFKAEGATGNWLACDNFRLYLMHSDLTELHSELQRRIELAQTCMAEKMQKELRTELDAAILGAKQELEATTDETLTEVAQRLRKATTEAQASVEAYQELQASVEKALEAYGDGNLNGADKLNEVIKEAQTVLEEQEAGADDLALLVTGLEKATLAFSLANATGTVPTVVTDTRYARGSVMAFGRSTVTGVAASQILERGFCWSTGTEPTVLDNRTTEYLSNNGSIYWIKNLEPSTVYYMRAYAMTKDYAVGYGDVIKVITLPKGRITWTYDNGADAAANARINAAVGSAVDWWNALTSINGLGLSVHYGAGTPTADCSYGGWMRVGPNSAYQQTGTILHEMGHAVGVGTHQIWWNGNLRANGDRGDWLGTRANEVLRFINNNASATMTGDNTHMWPYGINGAHEDNGSDLLYIANGLITQALGEDGLPPTGGFSTPAYVFEQEDNVKYYIKSESGENGLYSSYLAVKKGTTMLSNVKMTTEEAMANDSAAWTVTFNPRTCYYQFRNVATGRYVSYNAQTNRFFLANKETLTATENFHLMRGRNTVTMGTSGQTVSTHGYWIIYPDGTASPKCLSSGTTDRTTVDTYDLADSADKQRWLIMSGSELSSFDSAAKEECKSELNEMLDRIRLLAETPHTEDVEGADARLSSTLQDIETSGNEPETTLEGMIALKEEALKAGMDFLAEATPQSVERPFDLTFLMADAGLTDGDGWSTVPTISYSCGEYFQNTFDFNQVIDGLPAGTYQFKGQGFQRPGTAADAYSAFVSGQDKVNAVIYAGETEQLMKSIAAEAQTKKLGGSEKAVGSNPVKYVPDNMQAASLYFAAGLYDNGVVAQLAEDGSSLKVGMRSREMGSSYWCIFDNFRLYYYGSMSPDIVSGISHTVADKSDKLFAVPSDVYSLSGVCVRKQAVSLEGLRRGIYVVNGHKVVVR